MFTKNNCDHASPLLSEVLGEKLDMPGCARLFFFFRTRHITFSSFISPLSKWNYYPCSYVSSLQLKYLNKRADDTFNPTKDCNIGAEADFPAKCTGLTLSPQPGCAQCLLRHSTRGPSLWFVTYRNKWPGIVRESPTAFRTLFSWKITQPPEAHEPWEASAAADPFRKKVSQAPEEEKYRKHLPVPKQKQQRALLCPQVIVCLPSPALHLPWKEKVFLKYLGTEKELSSKHHHPEERISVHGVQRAWGDCCW